ncbi:MAG: UDP-N-acetylglucosamine 2-epimerase [Oligoflexia bacterium]|nr:UDP-N-acetylglucosamine 2-epimerase [Oligoflexia bacterium]MBF0365010.1 UDP-N-acetylglucosamine 2-epimerase [Oligoflexia bacterium]
MIHVVIGTKAQLIKMAPILRKLQEQNIAYNYISTGQHKATIDDILLNFKIKKPDLCLYTGKDITSLPQMFRWTLSILLKTLLLRKKIFRAKGVVLVHGDTFSTLLGALMGKVAGLKVAHIESGLRSFNLWQPFPEELTRLGTFYLADYMFCPGDIPFENLKNFSAKKIRINTKMNTLLDSLNYALPAIKEVQGVEVPKGDFAIATLHRFENFRNKESTLQVVESVERVANRKKILFILHKPTERNLKKFDLLKRLQANPNIELRPRYDYFQFMKLLMAAQFILSDGGSNQEECFYLGKPVILLRNVTERSEGVGRNAVISKFEHPIIDHFLDHLQDFTYASIVENLNHETSPSEIIIKECTRI